MNAHQSNDQPPLVSSVATTSSGYAIRPLRADDGAAVLSLYQAAFGLGMAEADWNWLYRDNPLSPIARVAESESGDIVGHWALLRFRFLNNGSQGEAGSHILGMVHPGFQRRGILQALVADGERQAQRDGIKLAFGFNNDKAFPVYIRHLGFRPLTNKLPVWFAILDMAAALRHGPVPKSLQLPVARFGSALSFDKSPRVKSSPTFRLLEVTNFDQRVTDLWNRIQRVTCVATYRGADYLNWRFSNKRRVYTRIIAEEQQQVIGLLVVRADDKFGVRLGYIAELLFDPDRQDVGLALLNDARTRLRSEGCALATALAFPTQRFLTRTLRKARFFQLPAFLMPHGIHLTMKPYAPGNEMPWVYSSANWFISWSDHDVV